LEADGCLINAVIRKRNEISSPLPPLELAWNEFQVFAIFLENNERQSNQNYYPGYQFLSILNSLIFF
jgi:hypothetical protein